MDALLLRRAEKLARGHDEAEVARAAQEVGDVAEEDVLLFDEAHVSFPPPARLLGPPDLLRMRSIVALFSPLPCEEPKKNWMTAESETPSRKPSTVSTVPARC